MLHAILKNFMLKKLLSIGIFNKMVQYYSKIRLVLHAIQRVITVAANCISTKIGLVDSINLHELLEKLDS